MRKVACQILGVSELATEEEIKNAYKRLIKLYHPDSGNTKDINNYHNVVWAYNYLKDNRISYVNSGARVMGSGYSSTKNSYSYSKAREYAQFEKKYQKQKEERLNESARRTQAEREQREKIDKVMEAINAIRVAEALKAMIQDSDSDNIGR